MRNSLLTVSLRSVKKSDWQFILEIRNQKEVRMACHDTTIIEYTTHEKYMQKLENDPNCYHWIVKLDDEDVGYVKLINGEFGYMVKDGYRGKGIGKKIFSLVFEEAKKRKMKSLHGIIKIEQSIPYKVATKMGFVQKKIINKDGKPYAYYLEKNLE